MNEQSRRADEQTVLWYVCGIYPYLFEDKLAAETAARKEYPNEAANEQYARRVQFLTVEEGDLWPMGYGLKYR